MVVGNHAVVECPRIKRLAKKMQGFPPFQIKHALGLGGEGALGLCRVGGEGFGSSSSRIMQLSQAKTRLEARPACTGRGTARWEDRPSSGGGGLRIFILTHHATEPSEDTH
jgi:hypothetical protein